MDPLVLSDLIKITHDILSGVSAAADRKIFLTSVLVHFDKNYNVDLSEVIDIAKYTDKDIEAFRVDSVVVLNASRICESPIITEEIRSAASDVWLGIAWRIVENDMGLFGLQRHTRAIWTLFDFNKAAKTPLCRQLASEGHLDTLRNLSSGKKVDDPTFNSLKRAMKRIIEHYT
jgi:hypothetical protein